MANVIEDKTFSIDPYRQLLLSIDFYDVFSTTNHKNNLEEIAHLIFNNPPNWVKALFGLRQSIMTLLGHKFNMPTGYHNRFEVGGHVSFFKIYSINNEEVVMGADDKHLKFRAVIHNTNAPNHNIKVVTLVEFNNAFGKLYMWIVAPFHRIVLKGMLKNAYFRK